MLKNNREVEFVHASLKGRKRSKNKDGILNVRSGPYSIVGVFDGVSSAVGAKRGVAFAIDYIKKNHGDYFICKRFCLAKMMRDVNSSLARSGIEEPYTTYSVACIPRASSENILVSSLGDSRVYAITNQYISQISFFENDQIHSNLIDRCLGMGWLASSDFKEEIHRDSEGDLFICSDGFYTVMESNHTNLSEAHRIFKFKNLYSVKKGLMRLVSGSNEDDASFMYVRWADVCQ